TLGWEAYAVDIRSATGDITPPLGRRGFADLVALASEAISALAGETIVLGHGLGGLIALKLAEGTGVKAAVAYAPTLPGSRSPLLGGVANRPSRWFRGPLAPPRGRLLYEFIADSEPFMRDTLIRGLVPDTSRAMHEISRGMIDLKPTPPAAPRLVVVGDAD